MENNTNNTTQNSTGNYTGMIGIILVLLFILISAGAYLYYKKAEAPSQNEVMDIQESKLASNCGLTVRTPLKGDAVSFPLTLTGEIDNTNADTSGCAWTMSEGQGGVAELYYETKDGFSLPVDTQPIIVADWMTTSTTFTVTLNFDNSMEQFPAGYNFKIVLREENPSGEGVVDTVELPVVLK